MAPRPHPPAWYPDPRDPRRVRRWDGRAWTGEVRPVPDWLRTLRLAPGPARRRRSGPSSRRLWLASAALLLLGAALMVALTPSTPEAVTTIGDTAFAAAAEARCVRHAQEVAPARPGRDRAVAAGWEAVVADLRQLEVAPADRMAVRGWLSDWDVLNGLGQAHAVELEAGDGDGARAVRARMAAAREVVGRFAVANAMPSCSPA